MNPLEEWQKEFDKKRRDLIKKYNLKTVKDVIEFFRYSNLRNREPDFCPLFKEGAKCHDLLDNELICFFCACPYFDYSLWDEENKIYGRCIINSKYGFRNEYGYWDCSKCLLPHREKFVKFYLKKYNMFIIYKL